jgi:hypothetical protein
MPLTENSRGTIDAALWNILNYEAPITLDIQHLQLTNFITNMYNLHLKVDSQYITNT